MKKFWILALLAVVVGIVLKFVFYNTPKYEYYQAATPQFRFVKCTNKGVCTYGMEKLSGNNEWEEIIPTEYSELSFQGTVLIGSRENSDFLYLFTRDGEPLFELMGIKDFKYYNNNNTYNFYKRRFALGSYILLEMVEGEGAVFIQDGLDAFGWISVCSFGPFEEFVPGCYGYMYKDVISNKWGYQVCHYWEKDRSKPAVLQEDYQLLKPEYDQIIEHYNPANVKKSTIFARKGNVWYAFNKQGQAVTYSKTLLDALLSMDPLPKVSEDPRYSPWRVGKEEASVAFYGKY